MCFAGFNKNRDLEERIKGKDQQTVIELVKEYLKPLEGNPTMTI